MGESPKGRTDDLDTLGLTFLPPDHLKGEIEKLSIMLRSSTTGTAPQLASDRRVKPKILIQFRVSHLKKGNLVQAS